MLLYLQPGGRRNTATVHYLLRWLLAVKAMLIRCKINDATRQCARSRESLSKCSENRDILRRVFTLTARHDYTAVPNACCVTLLANMQYLIVNRDVVR